MKFEKVAKRQKRFRPGKFLFGSFLMAVVLFIHVLPRGHSFFDYRDESNYIDDFTMRYMRNIVLIQDIENNWLVRASSNHTSTIDTTVIDYSEVGQAQVVNTILGGKTNGFFVECGGYNGLTSSNTYYLEKEKNWTGLLIEAVPHFYKQLCKNRPNTHRINACLSTNNKAEKAFFKNSMDIEGIGGLAEHMSGVQLRYRGGARKNAPTIEVQCFPFYSIMLTLGITDIDYFSLDVEGAELPVLRTIPFDKINVKVFTIEYRLSDGVHLSLEETQKKLDSLRHFLIPKGYREYGVLTKRGDLKNYDHLPLHLQGLDVVFYKL
ncbi:protein Star [Lingula anatina]|uniref:Protein Star n=1 Tax=Lingula anatina TaxID=7574 RepID=A0A1S3I8P5_LINAN|nr:protein Star [Lingula anatina]|eukprot:XP_013394563.1 protein Star [Lingula anatina]